MSDMHLRVNVDDPTDPAKVKVYGPGVEPGVKAAKPVWFTVDCTKAGKLTSCMHFLMLVLLKLKYKISE
jgi:hypothetical protein